MFRREWAALDAEKRFRGRNWRRIKREMNKARKVIMEKPVSGEEAWLISTMI
jgi:hypothetical protein